MRLLSTSVTCTFWNFSLVIHSATAPNIYTSFVLQVHLACIAQCVLLAHGARNIARQEYQRFHLDIVNWRGFVVIEETIIEQSLFSCFKDLFWRCLLRLEKLQQVNSVVDLVASLAILSEKTGSSWWATGSPWTLGPLTLGLSLARAKSDFWVHLVLVGTARWTWTCTEGGAHAERG